MSRVLIDRRRFMFSTTFLAVSSAATLGWAVDAKDAEVLVTNLAVSYTHLTLPTKRIV